MKQPSAASETWPDTPAGVLATLDDRWHARQEPRRTAPGAVYLAACATSDITQPYHSLSYLGGALDQAGLAWSARDLGVEFWHYVMAPPVATELGRLCIERADAGVEPRALFELYAHLAEDAGRWRVAWESLQDPRRFFHLPTYLDAVQHLSLLPWLLNLLVPGSDYRTFSSASPPGYRSTWIDLAELAARTAEGFGVPVLDLFYEHHAERIAALRPAFVGITVPFLSQVEHSLVLGARLRRRGVPVAMGGPMMAKFVKYAETPEVLGSLRVGCDWLAAGEGETTVVALAHALRAGRAPVDAPNLIDLARPRFLDRVHFERLNRLSAPDYSVWDWSLYAAPEPGGLYSPTRGCYWNKCEFCDYGLAVDGPTSPWRARSPERVVEDLARAAPHVRRFFFAVDVLSPAYATSLSRAIVDAGLDVSWMADFRLESTFDLDKVSLYRESGCVGGAFGMESADQTTLDNICKGTDSVRLPDVVAAFADAGIPVQLMGFLGFPRETPAAAEVTLASADRLLRRAATVALGRFGLTKGSLVAKDPARHGIELVHVPMPAAAVAWDIPWRHLDGSTQPGNDDPEAMESLLRLTRGFPYPFLGATSTHHSQLWFERTRTAPFPIPHWSPDRLAGQRFHVVPAYERALPRGDGRALLLSRLCGRALDLPAAFANELDALFAGGSWPVVDGRTASGPATTRLLEFLAHHRLAMFLSEEEARRGGGPAAEPA